MPTLEAPEHFSVLDFPVHLLNDYSSWLSWQLQQQTGAHVVTLNAEMTMQAEQNPALASIIRQAELVVPDGSGIVLYFRLQGKSIQRCPGIELSESLLRQSVQVKEPWSVFFYGGAPGVAETAAQSWKQWVPELNVVGVQHGYLSAEEKPDFLKMLKALQPRIILVGLGVPRQELWIAEHRHLCPNSIWIGVGGSFDVWAGVKSRAPGWLRDNHLEWVYRLYQEPWRWRRMLALPKFVYRSLVHQLTQKSTVGQDCSPKLSE